MQHIRQHWSLMASMNGFRGVLFVRFRPEGFAGYVPRSAEAANDNGPRAA